MDYHGPTPGCPIPDPRHPSRCQLAMRSNRQQSLVKFNWRNFSSVAPRDPIWRILLALPAAVYCCPGPWQLFSALDLWSYGAMEPRGHGLWRYMAAEPLGSRLFILKNHHHPIVACADGWGFNSVLDIYKLHSIYTQHESVIFTFLQSSE